MALNIDINKISKDISKNAKGAKNAVAGAADKTQRNLSKAAGVAGKGIATGATEASKAIGQAATVAGGAIAKGANDASKAAGEAIEDHKRRKYSPLFLEQYEDENFDMPKLVVIADEDSRKNIEMCEGAIGWLNTRHVPEIIFMYEEFVPKSGIRFYPRAICGGAFYRHPFEKNLYLQVKDYLKICKTNQLTELKNIANYLGARHCSVEDHEDKSLLQTLTFDGNLKGKGTVKGQKVSGNTSQNYASSHSANESLSIVMSESFEPSDKPQRPELLWFADDFEIQSLIEKRCNPKVGGTLNSYSIDITASTSSTISHDLACKIDASLKWAGIKAGGSLSSTLEKEEKKRFIYKIEF